MKFQKSVLCVLMVIVGLVSGLFSNVKAGETETMIENWISQSMMEISKKVNVLASEQGDPFYVPRVLMGPIVTRTLPQQKFYESQLSLLLRDAIYLKLAAGLAPVGKLDIVDLDVLIKALDKSGLGTASKLNISEISTEYSKDSKLRYCLGEILSEVDMLILGQITLKDKQALTAFTVLRMKDNQLYMDHTPVAVQAVPKSIQDLPNVPDISMNISQSSMAKMIEFEISTDGDIQHSVRKFVKEFTEAWKTGDVNKVMSFYDDNASAVTLTLSQNSRIQLTNVLNRNSLELVMVEFFDRYRVTNFDFSNPEVYDIKRNSRNVVSCSVKFFADITLADGTIQKLPLLSFYMQLRKEDKQDWKIYFQRIKEASRYSVSFK
ncbi:hypothetical protein GF312_14040 [Candidatus Poribacteria bacterium]|nr:hypothetical protein [Candidatus Poribacteria bacterium]